MAEQSLRTLQLCILDIALEFKRICDKYGIDYFFFFFTLLGAVRHHGFIPWDDDMDVGMTRKNYERFLKVAAKELRPQFFLQTAKTDPSFAHGFAKIRLNGTVLMEDYTEHSAQHNGVFLDVFPYDEMADSPLLLRLQYLHFKCLKWAALGKTDYQFVDKKKHYFASAMSKALFFYSKNKCIDKMTKICTRYLGKNQKNIINWYGAYKFSEYMDRKCAHDLVSMEFEGYSFKVPADYDILLKNMYGDYMKLPPIEKRGNQHAMVKMDIGEYHTSKKA